MDNPLLKAETPYHAALYLYDRFGFSISPPIPFGAKHPEGERWKQYQTERAARSTIIVWGQGSSNYGVITGKLSRIIVIEADSDEAMQLVEKRCPLTPWRVLSGSRRGCHYYYRYPAVTTDQGGRIGNRARIVVDGAKTKIDIRGDGGLVVGPCSKHHSGNLYQPLGTWQSLDELPEYQDSWFPSEKPLLLQQRQRQEISPENRSVSVSKSNTSISSKQELATEYLLERPGSTQGKGASGYCYALAIELIHGFDLSPEEALPVLAEWGTKASNVDEGGGYYPWSEEELIHKLDDANDAYCEKERGYLLPPDIDNQLEKYLSTLKTENNIMFNTNNRFGYLPAEYLSIPPAKFLIRHHVVERTVSMLFGPSGAGKSFYALDMAFACGLGKPFLGQFWAKKCPVVYLVSEGDGAFGVRLQAYEKHHGVNLADIDNVLLVPQSFNFQDIGTTLPKIVQGIQQDLRGQRPELIIIDTLARNIGGDENSPADMNGFIAMCDSLRRIFGAAILIVHHEGKDGGRGARGHSSLFAACDSVIRVTGDATTEGVVVYCDKIKNAKPFAHYALTKTVVTVNPDDRDNPDSLILTYDGAAVPQEDKLKEFAALFSTDPIHAESLQAVLNRDKGTLARFNWHNVKTLKNRAKEAVDAGLLGVHPDDKGKTGVSFRYFRPSLAS